MKPRGPTIQGSKGAGLPSDPGFRALVASLQRVMPAFDPAAEAARIDRSDMVPEGAGANAASAPRPAAQPAPIFDSLAALEKAWPAGARAGLDRLSDFLRSTCLVWGSRLDAGSDEARRAQSAIQERRDAAVRLASAQLYSAARGVAISDDVIDQVAGQVAQELSVELFSDLSSVFAVPRGMLVEAEHELVGRSHPNGRIRALTFGIRTRGRVTSKASVEADVPPGGRS